MIVRHGGDEFGGRESVLNIALNKDKDRGDKNSALFSQDGSNYSRYVEVYKKLLLLNEGNNLASTLKNIQE